MTRQLVLSTLGSDQPGLVDNITQFILDLDLNIEDSRMSILGGEFAIILLLTGDESQLQKLVETSSALEDKFPGLLISSKFTQPKNLIKGLSYRANVIALDHQGIVNKLARFFFERNINITDLNTSSYAAAHTGSKMFDVDIRLTLNEDTEIKVLRSAFIQYCDDLNLDAKIEVDRH